MTSTPPLALSIAASDPTGGAGAQADLLTLASLGCQPLSVLTAVTAQDTAAVAAVYALPAEQILAQAHTLLADLTPAAVKIGLLASAANARAVATLLDELPNIPVVLDPVLASGRGHALVDAALLETLITELLPRTALLTPNGPEARCLSGATELADCAQRLLSFGVQHVLITGGHENDVAVTNILYGREGEIRRDRWPRLAGEYHGSGCTLAAAIAGWLALGEELSQAVVKGQQTAWHALAAGFQPASKRGGQRLPWRGLTPSAEVPA